MPPKKDKGKGAATENDSFLKEKLAETSSSLSNQPVSKGTVTCPDERDSSASYPNEGTHSSSSVGSGSASSSSSSASSSSSSSASSSVVIDTATSAGAYLAAYEQLKATINKANEAGGKYKGHLDIAKQCVNGLPEFWGVATGVLGQVFQVLRDGGTVVGLSRLRIEKRSAALKIEDVVAFPGGKGHGEALIKEALHVASTNKKTEVWLEAADERVGRYYKKLGFVFETDRAVAGRMRMTLP
jgi:hypothetical protein